MRLPGGQVDRALLADRVDRAVAVGRVASVEEQRVDGLVAVQVDDTEAAPSRGLADPREILRLVAEHRTNPEIAARLSVAPKTVRNHPSNIFVKLQVATRAEDLRALSAIYGAAPGEVAEQLLDSGLLAFERAPQHEPAQP